MKFTCIHATGYPHNILGNQGSQAVLLLPGWKHDLEYYLFDEFHKYIQDLLVLTVYAHLTPYIIISIWSFGPLETLKFNLILTTEMNKHDYRISIVCALLDLLSS